MIMTILGNLSRLNAGSLLWIAETVGVDELTMCGAYETAFTANDYHHPCSVSFERPPHGT